MLRAAREARGWSRATLADASGTSEPAISRTELYGNQPRLSTLEAWADALGLTVGDLLVPSCVCVTPDLDGIGMCRECKRKPLAVMAPPEAS